MYSVLKNILNKIRQANLEMLRRYRKKKSEASRHLTFAIEIAELCHDLQLTFVLEHPWSDASWTDRKTKRLAKRSGVHVSKCDQCMTGLLSSSGLPQRKSTGLATNNVSIAQQMNIECDKQHQHKHIIGGKASQRTQIYPEDFKNRIIHAYKSILDKQHSTCLQVTCSHDMLREYRAS